MNLKVVHIAKKKFNGKPDLVNFGLTSHFSMTTTGVFFFSILLLYIYHIYKVVGSYSSVIALLEVHLMN